MQFLYSYSRRLVVAFWLIASGFMLANSDWPGLVICVLGFIGTQLISGAIRSRGRRP